MHDIVVGRSWTCKKCGMENRATGCKCQWCEDESVKYIPQPYFKKVEKKEEQWEKK